MPLWQRLLRFCLHNWDKVIVLVILLVLIILVSVKVRGDQNRPHTLARCQWCLAAVLPGCSGSDVRRASQCSRTL